MRRLSLCAFVLTCSGLATPALMAGRPVPQAPGSTAPRVVSAFYYPWFATTVDDGSYAHWQEGGGGSLREIQSLYYPALGVYSSDDPTVLRDQMREIQRSGIGQIAVSWWGWGSVEDERLPAVIQAARARGLDVAVQIEPYPGRSIASMGADVAHLMTLGITTFYIYQAFSLGPSSWAPVNDTLRAEGVTMYAQSGLVGQAVAGHFSGIYTYDIVTWTAAKFTRLCAEAHAHGLLCAPSVGPGYDATRATGDPRVKPRRDGLTYDTMWRAAIRARADSITITSFNEWQEGTQIEPAAPPERHRDVRYISYNGAWGLDGQAAEQAYLDRTAYWAALYEDTGGSPSYRRPT